MDITGYRRSREAVMGQSEPTPDSRQIVEELENDIVDVDGVRSRDEAAEKGMEKAAPDGTRAVPGSPEPPD
ncbi:MAG TPA: hypothetical protein VM688_05045 [Nocardioidaceae bacterium]|nr:hypothetical protein [Nocardioidaceae bacterium]